MTGSTIPLAKVLHLKSGVAYLEHNRLVAAGEFTALPDFASYEIIKVDEDEQYAANCLWLNGIVLTSPGFPKITSAIGARRCQTMQVDMSKSQKLDGGLSCLSLLYNSSHVCRPSHNTLNNALWETEVSYAG